ncbi:MAG: cupin domain-containing protein [Methylococcales bacterium]|nr:cupin domain-containing protein [Methylococcales bacterium]
MDVSSVFAGIPKNLPDELCQTLLTANTFRIERIVSRGHSSNSGFWYDQAEDEWVMILKGRAVLTFADDGAITLEAGDYLLIPAHCKHRVEWTSPTEETVWLAIHFTARTDHPPGP